MPIQNKWLTPFQRSYTDIKNTLITKLAQNAPEITDTSEGNIFMVIISIWSAIAEVIHYYIDNTARETFLTTARRYSSVFKHAKFVDYHIKAASPASIDITLYKDKEPLKADIIIPINTQFKDSLGNIWVNTKEYLWSKNTYSISIGLMEKQIASNSSINFGTTYYEDIEIPINNIPGGKYYVEGSMVLQIGLEVWQLVETFAYSKPSDKHYKVELNESRIPVIIFGDGINGSKPTICQPILGNYYVTTGASGNIESGQFLTTPTNLKKIDSDIKIISTTKASGGNNYETFDQIKQNIPLSIKTLGVAITKDDYESLAKLQLGVSKAYVNYICGRYIEVYITPEQGGTASQSLIDQVTLNLSKSKVLTTSINVKSTRDINLYLEATVTGKPSYSSIDIANQVTKALVDTYSFASSDINKPIRLSDIYSLIDQLSLVDHLIINGLYFIPNIYPANDNQVPLQITAYNQSMYNHTEDYIFGVIDVISNTEYKLYIEGDEFIGTFGTPLIINSNLIQCTLTLGTSGSANIGDKYQMYFQPMNSDMIPFNYTIPIITLSNIKLNVNATV